MLNTETREVVGVQYEVELEGFTCLSQVNSVLSFLVEQLPHVQKVTFDTRTANGEQYVVCIIIVDAHADNLTLWRDIEAVFAKEFKE